ncbi:hypothetical protein [Synechococcus sp. BIOS-U3-1]|uniref:hypothetical protein n=1 Tax=Synechococcus sp. BIOS-U3-1 TaxID=1400865 RepID=UPI001647C6B5|nr:hypothetical protein [Synechococcus sp. BIOS-U3-1]
MIGLDAMTYGSGHVTRLNRIRRLMRDNDPKIYQAKNYNDLKQILKTNINLNIILDVCSPKFYRQLPKKKFFVKNSNYRKVIAIEGLAQDRHIADLFCENIKTILPYCINKEELKCHDLQNTIYGPHLHTYGGLTWDGKSKLYDQRAKGKHKILLSAGYSDPASITREVLTGIQKCNELRNSVIVYYTSSPATTYNFDKSQFKFAKDIGQDFFKYIQNSTHMISSSGLIKYDGTLNRKKLYLIHPDQHHRRANSAFETQTSVDSCMIGELSSDVLNTFVKCGMKASFKEWPEEQYYNVMSGRPIKEAIINLLSE